MIAKLWRIRNLEIPDRALLPSSIKFPMAVLSMKLLGSGLWDRAEHFASRFTVAAVESKPAGTVAVRL